MNTIRRLLFAFCALLTAARAELPPLPQPATSFGAALADGWLYVYGGNTGNAHEFHRDCVRGDFFRLRVPDGNAWEPLTGGTALLSSALVAHEGKIIRIGGMNARNAKGEKKDLHSTDEVMRYDPAKQAWEKLAPLPEPRSSHDAVVIGDMLYVGGGWKLAGNDGEGEGAKWHDTALSLDLRAPEKGWQTVPQPFQRRALAAVAHEGRVWFLGGMDHQDEPSRTVDWWEPATGKWGHGPDLPDGSMAGFGIAGCVGGGRVLASPLSGKISALSADSSKWEEIAELAKARFFHRLLPLADGRLIAVGGSSRKGQIPELELITLGKKSSAPAPAAAPVKSANVKQPTERGGIAWSQWRGPNRDGVSNETGWRKDWPAEGPRVLWRAKVGAGMSSCVVADGRLFTQGNNGEGTDSLFALDAATGAELWRFSLPCKTDAHEMPIVPSGPGATPTISGGHVFVLTREGDLLALETATGNLAWRKNLVTDLGGKRPVYGYAQSPLVEGGRIFLDVGAAEKATGSTVALDAATGEVAWRAGTGEAGYSSARIFERDGRRLVAMFKGEALDIFDPADGRVLASHRTTARDFCNAATPAFIGHQVLVSNTGTDLAALLDWDFAAEPNVRAVWEHKQFSLLFNSAIAHDGHLFAYNEKRRGHHEFTCVDARTGESKWVSDAVPTGTFLLADGHWIFLTREGDIALAPANSDGLKPTARFHALDGKCYASPTLANGRLFVRSNTGDIIAYDLRLK